MDLFSELALPFEEGEIEWRISQVFAGQGADIKAKCLAYVDSRAVMNRLDAVIGPDCWGNKTTQFNGGFMCELSLFIDGKWVVKTDGSDPTDFEGVKGGISSSLKRAAVLCGIGRYLYQLEEGWAKVGPGGKHYQSGGKGGQAFKWDAPELPDWAKWPKGLPPHGDLVKLQMQLREKTIADLQPGIPSRFWFRDERRILKELGFDI